MFVNAAHQIMQQELFPCKHAVPIRGLPQNAYADQRHLKIPENVNFLLSPLQEDLYRYCHYSLQLTYWMTKELSHALMRTQANSTYRTTRGQTFNSLCLPLVTRRSGELTPLYTSTLLYNNLPSELRSPNISFSLFHCTIMKYLGHPVRRP